MTATVTMRVDVSPPEWLLVPDDAAAHPTWRDDAIGLFEIVAAVDAGADPEDRLFDDGRPVEPEDAVDVLLAFAARMRADGSDAVLVAGMTVPNRWPLPVVVTAAPSDDQDLVAALGATGGRPARPPIVEPLPDGTGIVVQRFDLADDGSIWVTVAAARRLDGIDTVAVWRTDELELLPAFVPDVVGLLGAVHVTA